MGRGNNNKVVAYRGEQITIAAVDGWHCPACGECEFARGEGKRYAAAVVNPFRILDKHPELVEETR